MYAQLKKKFSRAAHETRETASAIAAAAPVPKLKTRTKVIAAIGVAAVGVPLAIAYTMPETEAAQQLVVRFTDAIDRGDFKAAAELTSYPSAAEETLRKVSDGLHAQHTDFALSQFVEISPTEGRFTLEAKWTFGKENTGKDNGGKTREWKYATDGAVRRLANSWRIVWAPSVLAPDLKIDGTVRQIRSDGRAALILDSDGDAIMTEQQVHSIDFNAKGLDAATVKTATNDLADIISVVAPQITGTSLRAKSSAANGRSISAVQLRDDDFGVLEEQLRSVPGMVEHGEPQLVAQDRRLASPLIDLYRTIWQQDRDATQGWEVRLENPGESAKHLVGQAGPPRPDITVPMSLKLHLAAQDAVVSVGTPAAIVALKPSTGEILSVVQNSWANAKDAHWYAKNLPGSGIEQLTARSPEAAKALGLGGELSIPGYKAVASSAGSLSLIDRARIAGVISQGSLPPLTLTSVVAPIAPPVPALNPELLRTLREAFEKTSVNGLTGVISEDSSLQWLMASSGDLAFAVVIEKPESSDAVTHMATMMLRGA